MPVQCTLGPHRENIPFPLSSPHTHRVCSKVMRRSSHVCVAEETDVLAKTSLCDPPPHTHTPATRSGSGPRPVQGGDGLGSAVLRPVGGRRAGPPAGLGSGRSWDILQSVSVRTPSKRLLAGPLFGRAFASRLRARCGGDRCPSQLRRARLRSGDRGEARFLRPSVCPSG